MDVAEFNEQYQCTFESNPRDEMLIDKLKEYYQLTDKMENRFAFMYWVSFKKWCTENGYTTQDVNDAKRTCLNCGII